MDWYYNQIYDFHVNFIEDESNSKSSNLNKEIENLTNIIDTEFYNTWYESPDDCFHFGFYKHYINKFLNFIVPTNVLDKFLKVIIATIDKELISIDSTSRDLAFTLKQDLMKDYDITLNSFNEFYMGFPKEKIEFLKRISNIYDKIKQHNNKDKTITFPGMSKDLFLFLFKEFREVGLIHKDPYNPFYNDTDLGYVLHLLSGYSYTKLRTYGEQFLAHDSANKLIIILNLFIERLKNKYEI